MLKVFVKIKKIQEIAEQGASPERARVPGPGEPHVEPLRAKWRPHGPGPAPSTTPLGRLTELYIKSTSKDRNCDPHSGFKGKHWSAKV